MKYKFDDARFDPQSGNYGIVADPYGEFTFPEVKQVAAEEIELRIEYLKLFLEQLRQYVEGMVDVA